MYEVTWINPQWTFRSKPEVLQTTRKSEVTAVVRRARAYPGSCEIQSITRTTKKNGVEYLSSRSF